MRYRLVDGQGNFGSIDGDNPAAMRYTEVRLTKLAEELMRDDIDKDTIDWVPNYDGTVGYKAVSFIDGVADTNAANQRAFVKQGSWRSQTAITRVRSASRRTAAATSSTGRAKPPSSSSRACSHTCGMRARLPEPSTNDGVYSTSCGEPSASVAATGAPVAGSAL